MNKLNEEYFKNKKIYKENYKKRKLTYKQRAINILITAILLFFVHLLQQQCSQKIKENEKQYNLEHKSNKQQNIKHNSQ